MDSELVSAATEIGKEVAQSAYNDVAHGALSSTGSLLGLIPRAINAALVPVREWIERKEYKLAETKRLLEIRLANVKPEDVVSPDAHIAVPAIQAISYSMDNEVVRTMYANLLGASMLKGMKGDVHPAFVEFIKQMSPDEARILRYVYGKHSPVPMLDLRTKNAEMAGCTVVSDFTSLYRDVPDLEVRDPNKTAVAVDNLSRLQLVVKSFERYLTDDSLYEALFDDSALSRVKQNFKHQEGFFWSQEKGLFEMTSLGTAFCRVCLEG